MRAICVDDESLILEMTVSECRKLPQLEEVTGFTHPTEALRWLDGHPADLALLDIEMPEMNGIALAARIKELRPNTAILFVTGYSQYAVDAFALHASGYLLKPVRREQLAAEVEYISSHRPAGGASAGASAVFVRTFGNFDVFVDGAPIGFARSKSRELLAYLVDRQGGSITRAQAFAVLWREREYNRAMQKQLDVIVRSLRDTLRSHRIDRIMEVRSGCLRVFPEQFECDLYSFLAGSAQAVNAYRGEYLSEYAWASTIGAYMTMARDRDTAAPAPGNVLSP